MLVAVVLFVTVGCDGKYNFVDDIVLVTLTSEASTEAKELSRVFVVSDFPEVALVAVENSLTTDGLVILSLRLKYPSHRNVLSTIEILEQREDILLAQPNFVFRPQGGFL